MQQTKLARQAVKIAVMLLVCLTAGDTPNSHGPSAQDVATLMFHGFQPVTEDSLFTMDTSHVLLFLSVSTLFT